MPTPSCTCGCICSAAKKMQSMSEEEKVFDFLMGLDDTYSTVHSQILSVDSLPNLGRVYAITAQEEKQRSIAANRISTIEAIALLTREVSWALEKSKGTKRLASTAIAATIEEAMSPISGLTHAQHQQLLLLLGNNGTSTVHTTLPPVQIPNGDMVKVHALGQVAIGKRLILEKVFGDLPSKMLIGVGRERNGLYYLEPMKGGEALMVKKSVSASLWQRRLEIYQ
ncbi:hypothetical protein KY290_031244 [Solanum tuberosum]|uniref:Uncharacterized protein n=1 Tax=Solanum tuberosum TaxID=4113 RepID=A0ABQ7UA78_SOLTU|nr:hypothetical protein KY290_031244 [Solanum tuberosum]